MACVEKDKREVNMVYYVKWSHLFGRFSLYFWKYGGNLRWFSHAQWKLITVLNIYIYLIQFKLENEKEHGERPKITWVKVTTNDMLIEKLIRVHMSQPIKWWAFIIQHNQSSRKEEWKIQLLIGEINK